MQEGRLRQDLRKEGFTVKVVKAWDRFLQRWSMSFGSILG